MGEFLEISSLGFMDQKEKPGQNIYVIQTT